jgi:hypothetical protein
MYVKMDKVKEEEAYVYYKFETDVSGGKFVTASGKERNTWVTKYGFCKFNKQTEEFELDVEKTDLYFLDKDNREAFKVKIQLMRFKRDNVEFPDIYDIATRSCLYPPVTYTSAHYSNKHSFKKREKPMKNPYTTQQYSFCSAVKWLPLCYHTI